MQNMQSTQKNMHKTRIEYTQRIYKIRIKICKICKICNKTRNKYANKYAKSIQNPQDMQNSQDMQNNTQK